MVYFVDLDIKGFVGALKEWEKEEDWDDADMKRLFEYFDQTGKTKVSHLNKILGTLKKTTKDGKTISQTIDTSSLFTDGKPDEEKIDRLGTDSGMFKIYFYSMARKNEIAEDIDSGNPPPYWLKPALKGGIRVIWKDGVVEYVRDGGYLTGKSKKSKKKKKYKKKKKSKKKKGKSKRKRSKTRRR